MVNDQKIKLPRSLRLPRMEYHQFYNRDRLLELEKLEFQTHASMRELSQLPPRENVDKAQTLIPPKLAQEKMICHRRGLSIGNEACTFIL